MKGTIKALSIGLVLVLLAFVAVIAGLSLAVWDTGSSVTEVYAMAFPVENIEIGEVETIEITEANVSDLAKEKVDTGVVDKPIKELVNDIKPPKNEEIEGNVKDFSEAGGIKSLTENSKNASGDATSEESSSEEEFEDSVEEQEEKAPLEITPEISGIATVVRAGDEENVVVNEIPVLAPIAETNVNIDPLADFPLPFTEVDNSYFDDALFIGDSRVAGLAMNSGTNATFYAVTSFQLYKYKTFKVVQTPNGKVPIFDAMPYDKFTKIYIKVGLNELGTVTDAPFLEAYESLINDLRIMQPRAIIYIQAILPVTAVKSQTDRTHCNENIARRNENLKTFAESMKCYFVDVGPYFADETGALMADSAADGIHMYAKYMPQWIDALRKQAVIWPPVQ